jgi:hypothetical protein
VLLGACLGVIRCASVSGMGEGGRWSKRQRFEGPPHHPKTGVEALVAIAQKLNAKKATHAKFVNVNAKRQICKKLQTQNL